MLERWVKKPPKQQPKVTKTVDVAYVLPRPTKGSIIKE